MKNKISIGTVSRTIVLILALFNQVITMFGKNPLPFSNDEIYTGVTALLTVCASLTAWWKTNGFTQAGIAGERYIKQLKSANK